jgi:uncharacterized protein YndB with AHSA1/START domain
MIKFQAEVTIDRPIEQVFRYVADATRQHEWTDMTLVKMLTEGPTRAGTQYVAKFKKGPFKELTFEINPFAPNRLLGYRSISQGPMAWEGEFRVDATGPSSTRVTAQGEIRLRGLWRLAELLLAGEVRRGEAAELERLKRILEAAS